jgi:DNA invertase Pin-like site-specific DNA recombinase
MAHVAVYTRETKARGREENVEVQAELATSYAQARWPELPVRVYCDNDITAADPGTFRPDYDRMLTDIKAGEIAHVVSADQERLTRQLSEWEQLSAILRAASVWEVHGYRDGITPVKLGQTAAGRYKAVAAAEYVEGVKIKVREKHAALAAEGRPRGGLEYGYRPGRNGRGEATLEVVPEQAAVIREVADRLSAGWSLAAVAKDLNARGVPTLRGRQWGATTVRRMISKPTVAGLRAPDVAGTWPAIIPVEQWATLRRMLDGRAVAKTRSRRRFLLTGLTTCGRCGGIMGAQNRKGGARSVNKARYFCRPYPGQCQRVSIGADALEEHLTATLLAELDKPEFVAAILSDAHEAERNRLTAELEGVEQRRAELAREVAAGGVTLAEWREMRAVLDRDEGRLSAELAQLPLPANGDLDPAAIREGWEAMTLDERRAVLAMFVERITVGPAQPGNRRFDPERVTIEWRAAG